MSWTQGIQVREDCPKRQVERMDEIGKIKLGEGYIFQAYVWDEAVPGVMYLDYQAANGDYRSLKYTYDKE